MITTSPAADVQQYKMLPGPPREGISISPNRWLGKADVVNEELKMRII